MADAIWITEAEVVQLLDLKEAIAALEGALREEARGEAQNMTKTLLQYGKNNLHAIGAKLGNLVGTKTWTHTQGGTCPLLLLWSAEDGSLAAVIEAFALGNLRTGGISGVAADWMARKDARVMALAGTGKQALAQVGTMLAVRPIERLQVYSPRPESRAEFAKKVREEFAIEAVACASAPEACRGAHIVTLVTRASQRGGRHRTRSRGVRAGRLRPGHPGGGRQSPGRAAAFARVHDPLRGAWLGRGPAPVPARRAGAE